MSVESPTEYEIATHKGRQMCESMSADYCGSIDLVGHIKQMGDSSSWIHSSLDGWLLRFKQSVQLEDDPCHNCDHQASNYKICSYCGRKLLKI